MNNIDVDKITLIWVCTLLFIISLPILIFTGMLFGSYQIAIYKAKNPNNIHTGCLFFEDRITGKVRFKLDAPNDPNLPTIRSANDFFSVYQFPIYQNSGSKGFKLERGFCNPVQFISVDFRIIEPYYYIYDTSSKDKKYE